MAEDSAPQDVLYRIGPHLAELDARHGARIRSLREEEAHAVTTSYLAALAEAVYYESRAENDPYWQSLFASLAQTLELLQVSYEERGRHGWPEAPPTPSAAAASP